MGISKSLINRGNIVYDKTLAKDKIQSKKNKK